MVTLLHISRNIMDRYFFFFFFWKTCQRDDRPKHKYKPVMKIIIIKKLGNHCWWHFFSYFKVAILCTKPLQVTSTRQKMATSDCLYEWVIQKHQFIQKRNKWNTSLNDSLNWFFQLHWFIQERNISHVLCNMQSLPFISLLH